MRFLTVADVASLLRVRRETVYQWIKDGKIASIHLGRSVRISEDELQRFIENRMAKANERH